MRVSDRTIIVNNINSLGISVIDYRKTHPEDNTEFGRIQQFRSESWAFAREYCYGRSVPHTYNNGDFAALSQSWSGMSQMFGTHMSEWRREPINIRSNEILERFEIEKAIFEKRKWKALKLVEQIAIKPLTKTTIQKKADRIYKLLIQSQSKLKQISAEQASV